MRVVSRIPKDLATHPIKQTNSNELTELNELGQTDTDTDKQEAANRAGNTNINTNMYRIKYKHASASTNVCPPQTPLPTDRTDKHAKGHAHN